MLEDVDEGGIWFWYLVKLSDELELFRFWRGSFWGGECECVKVIFEIYLICLLFMKGIL